MCGECWRARARARARAPRHRKRLGRTAAPRARSRAQQVGCERGRNDWFWIGRYTLFADAYHFQLLWLGSPCMRHRLVSCLATSYRRRQQPSHPMQERAEGHLLLPTFPRPATHAGPAAGAAAPGSGFINAVKSSMLQLLSSAESIIIASFRPALAATMVGC